MIFVYGFAGLRDYTGQLCFSPRIPSVLERLRFRLIFKEQVIEVDASRQTTCYTLRQGSGLTIKHEEEEIKLTVENPSSVQPNRKEETKVHV